MIKKVYAIYSKLDKDSSLFTASNNEEVLDVALQVIFESEEFDQFFDRDGKIKFDSENISYFYDTMKQYSLYCIGEYDSSNMRIINNELKDIDLPSFLDSFNKQLKNII